MFRIFVDFILNRWYNANCDKKFPFVLEKYRINRYKSNYFVESGNILW